MSSGHKQSETKFDATMRLWTHSQASKAIPYIRSITQSLREHWLKMRRARLQAERIDARPGRLDRQLRMMRDQFSWEAKLARIQFEEALSELMALDVYSLDPVRGLALIPFSKGDELAWFIFDLFAPEALVAWQLDADSPETRRPLVELLELNLSPKLPVADIDFLMSRGA